MSPNRFLKLNTLQFDIQASTVATCGSVPPDRVDRIIRTPFRRLQTMYHEPSSPTSHHCTASMGSLSYKCVVRVKVFVLYQNATVQSGLRMDLVVSQLSLAMTSSAVRLELTRVTRIDFESIALAAGPSCPRSSNVPKSLFET